MVTQTEKFAFYADHTTRFRDCDTRHGHTFEVEVEVIYDGDHQDIRRWISSHLELIHRGHINDVIGAGEVEAVAVWLSERLGHLDFVPVRVVVTELSASDDHQLLRHTKTWRPDPAPAG